MTLVHRRSFLIGLGAVFAAPAIVKAESLMKVKAIVLPSEHWVKRVAHNTEEFRTAIPQARWRQINQGVPYLKNGILGDISYCEQAIKDSFEDRVAWERFWSESRKERQARGIDFASTGAPIEPLP